jgi:hypothetical protein
VRIPPGKCQWGYEGKRGVDALTLPRSHVLLKDGAHYVDRMEVQVASDMSVLSRSVKRQYPSELFIFSPSDRSAAAGSDSTAPRKIQRPSWP